MSFGCLDPAITLGSRLAGSFIDWGRNFAAKRLEGGDVLSEQIRKALITELREINSKLDAFARRELKSSISFMNAGFIALEMAIDQSPSDLEDRNVDRPGELHEGTILALPSRRRITLSEYRLAEARRWFEQAIINSTQVFHNKGLTIEDIIVACRLRIISRVFLNFDDLNFAAKHCFDYVKELHENENIKSNFAVHDRGGLRAMLKRGKRCNIISSVNGINYVLFNFMSQHTGCRFGIFDWPMIYLGAQRWYHPICESGDILESASAKIPWEMVYTHHQTWNGSSCLLAINSVGEILEVVGGCNLKITRLSGKTDEFSNLSTENFGTWHICSLAVDKHDDTYVMCEDWDMQSDIYLYNLLIFDKSGKLKSQVPFDFLAGNKKSIRIAVTNNKKIVIREGCQNCLFICDSSNGSMENAFYMPSMQFVLWSISKKNELIFANMEMDSLCVFTMEGTPKRTIKLPDGHLVSTTAFHGPTGDIFVYTCKSREDPTSFYLLRYSENGELLQSHFVRTWWNNDFKNILTHPNGVIALFSQRKAILIIMGLKFMNLPTDE